MPGKTSKQGLSNQQVLTQVLQRLDQLDHNVGEGFKNVDKRFEQSNQRFQQIDHRFEQIDQRFEQIDHRFGQIDQRFEQIDHRFGQIDQRLEQVDHRFGQIDQRFEQVDQRISKLEQHITQVAEQIRSELKDEIRGVLRMLPEIADDLLKRITALNKSFSNFRDVSLMTWAEIKRHLTKEDEEHKQIKQEMRDTQATMGSLQQKIEAHEIRITEIETAQNKAT